MNYLKVRNWDKWQSYRSDRGQPPWIKLHRDLLRNYEWIELSDAEKGQLVSIWLLAADKDGQIPDDPALVQKVTYLTKKPDLQRFVSLGFLEGGSQDDANVTSGWRQGDRPEVETETEYKTHCPTTSGRQTKHVNGSAFEKFWAAYPKKSKKQDALKLWKRMKLDEHVDILLEDISGRLMHDDKWLRDGGQYIPMPTTYLRGHRWEDEYESASSGSQAQRH